MRRDITTKESPNQKKKKKQPAQTNTESRHLVIQHKYKKTNKKSTPVVLFGFMLH